MILKIMVTSGYKCLVNFCRSNLYVVFFPTEQDLTFFFFK